MSLDDGLSKFLGSIYDAVHDEDGWRAAIAEIIQRTGSHRAVITTVDLRRAEPNNVQFHGPEDASVETGIREYAEEMSALDPALKWAIENPAAGVCDSASTVAAQDYCEHPFIKWSTSRFGTLHWRSFYSRPVEDLFFAIGLHAPPGAGPYGSEQLPLQQLLFENLERAVRLAARPPNFAADDSALIAIDASGRPLSMSQRAETILREADGLLVRDGRLSAQSPEAAFLLRRAILAAIDPGRGELPERGVWITRSGGRSDLLAVVSYFPPSVNHLPTPVPTALVRLIELDSRPEHLNEHSHLFDLSPREIEVASGLLQGHSIESLAADLGISRNTARNHVQALFEKTQTNRQSDLIRVLDRLARQ